jgi:hypothetical protein
MDLRTHLARSLDRLENHLAFVVSLHLFVENLIDALIELRSPTADLIFEDHRSFSFSVKLTLVFNMRLIPKRLFENIRALNRLRNEYAHRLDVNLANILAEKLGKQWSTRSGRPALPDVRATAREIERSPDVKGMEVLRSLRRNTFDWLLGECEKRGVQR